MSNKRRTKLTFLSLSGFLILVGIASLSLLHKDSVSADDTDFSNGITVDSTLDTSDANVGDGTCDDGDSNCTLRAAIEEANSDPDASTILFNIQETADFTNNSQDGYTIEPQSNLPEITEQLTINGYSQPGAQANTAIAPNPLNGTLLIEIDGGDSVAALPEIKADDSIIRGLVINNASGTGVLIGGDDIGIYGNYIGTDPTGLLEKGNTLAGINGGTVGFEDGDNALIGSVNPADRNVISGNDGAGITPNTGQDGWTVKGNYVGVGSDGVTILSNSFFPNGAGGLSIDNCSDTTVGGPEEGATNVISGNGSFGLFPDNTDGLIIQGNIIGPDWKGDPLVGSTQRGGIGLPPINGPFYNTLIGGTNPGEGNLIAYNSGSGVAVISVSFGPNPIGNTEKAAILGNNIHSNNANPGFILSESGLGIDLLDGDMQTQTSTTSGPTPNDPGDSDTGPNGFINFPVLNSVSQTGAQASINFNLDAADSPSDQYRVEFFANDTADPSGYGEGQTFLGSTTVSNGNNQVANLTLPSGLNLSGKSISATTTAIDNTTDSGFGATSEFSALVTASTVDDGGQSNDNNNGTTNSNSSEGLASTGGNSIYYVALALALVVGSIAVRKLHNYK